MDANDRKLISDMFDRMQNITSVEVDSDAEAFIHDRMRQNPISPYLLVQSVLVQEQALQKTNERIKALEREVAQRSRESSNKKGSFFTKRTPSGFGVHKGRGASVPQTGASPWQSSSYQTDQQNNSRRTMGGGGFMAQAMTTAAGVAGGMLLASGISSLISGASNSASAATDGVSETDAADTITDNTNEQLAADTSMQDTELSQQDTDLQEASSDESNFFGDWGGGDDSWGGDGDFDL
ncbi:MAG: hypothetical protein TECD_00395 [Hyphomicrobiaceae bacterium hypho_1]